MSSRRVPCKKKKAGQWTWAATHIPMVSKRLSFPLACFISLAVNQIVMAHWREVGDPRHLSQGIFQEPLLSMRALLEHGGRQCQTERSGFVFKT